MHACIGYLCKRDTLISYLFFYISCCPNTQLQGPEDVDQDKLARFHLGDDESEGGERRLVEQRPSSAAARSLAKETSASVGPCLSFKTIEVAIAYESRFCNFYGGAEKANQVVELTVAETSRKFQQPGLCTKVVLTHLEGYCDPGTDPYRNMFSGSVCKRDDNNAILKQFHRYWMANRSNVRRDVAHLFHGFAHATGTVGCAYGSALCDTKFGYGVNEITFGGNNNPTFWSQLFSHELGHSAGALHECCDGYLMDTTMCADCLSFSPASLAHMNFFMDQPDVAQCLQGSGGVVTNLAPPLLSKPAPSSTSGTNPRPVPSPPVPAPSPPAPAPAPPVGNGNGNSQCRKHLEYCNAGSCCVGITCYNGFICLDLD